MSVIISDVEKHSVCARKGIKPGDKLISINGNAINDVLDYRFYADDEKLTIGYENSKGKLSNCHIRRSQGVDSLGLCFETYLMDQQQHCKNSCIFCFIDQMPPGMRSSLYFKDDDSRLSFLFGNYITLTNLKQHDVDRIIRMHISPLNASVHTMDPELRVKMMKNPHAGESLQYLRRFSDAGISINAQLVLCPGINDGASLKFSLEKLAELENVKSIAAVPVGLTKYRDGLFPLTPYDKTGAAEVIDIIDRFNDKLISCGKDRLAYPSDEFYLLSGRSFPSYDYYGDFPQLDNGVGLYVMMQHDFADCMQELSADQTERTLCVATGAAAYPLIHKLADDFMTKYKNTSLSVHCIRNDFFGDKVTVAGLITGQDLIQQMKDKTPGASALLIPQVMLRGKSEPVFLDDVTVADAEKALECRIIPVGSSAEDLFRAFSGEGGFNV